MDWYTWGFFWFASQCGMFKVHLYWGIHQYLMPLYGWITFHCLVIQHFLSIISWRTHRFFPVGYNEKCYEISCTVFDLNMFSILFFISPKWYYLVILNSKHIFMRNNQIVIHSDCTVFIPLSAVQGLPHILASTWYFYILYIVKYLFLWLLISFGIISFGLIHIVANDRIFSFKDE